MFSEFHVLFNFDVFAKVIWQIVSFFSIKYHKIKPKKIVKLKGNEVIWRYWGDDFQVFKISSTDSVNMNRYYVCDVK